MSSLFHRGLCGLIAGLCGLAVTAQGQTLTYQSPDFDFDAFDADGVSLSTGDRGQVVDALAALSRNFSSSGDVDADLREKAVAIALRLDPLHGPARQTHEALLAEKLPTPVEFLTSRSKVGEILLSNAAKLQENRANADDQALALYLWELGLAIYPAPDFAQVSSYERALDQSESGEVPWEDFVTISPGSPSEIQLRRTVSRILSEGESLAETEPPPSNTPIDAASIFKETPPPMTEPAEPSPAPDEPMQPPAATLARETASLPFITSIGEIPTAGTFALTVRTPDQTEASLFGLFGGEAESGDFEMRLRVARDSPFRLNGVRNASALVRKDYPRWPDNLVAIGSFTPLEGATADSGGFNAFLPGAIVVRSLFTEALSLRQDLVVIGESVSPGDDTLVVETDTILSLLEEAKGKDFEAVLVPESAETILEEFLLTTDDPMFLLRPQILSMSDLAAFEAHLTDGGMPEPTSTAMTEFTEIEDLLDKELTLRQIATNEIVQGRLTGIVEKCPNHLSAKLLLAWGQADLPEISTNMSLIESLDAVDTILAPFVQQLEEARDGSGAFDPDIDDDLGEAFSDLRRLAVKIDPQAKDYLRLAEDSLDPFEFFLSIRDKTTSSALQKRTAVTEVLTELEQMRDSLGED